MFNEYILILIYWTKVFHGLPYLQGPLDSMVNLPSLWAPHCASINSIVNPLVYCTAGLLPLRFVPSYAFTECMLSIWHHTITGVTSATSLETLQIAHRLLTLHSIIYKTDIWVCLAQLILSAIRRILLSVENFSMTFLWVTCTIIWHPVWLRPVISSFMLTPQTCYNHLHYCTETLLTMQPNYKHSMVGSSDGRYGTMHDHF